MIRTYIVRQAIKADFNRTYDGRNVSVKSQMSLVMRNPAFCICENKDADQLRGNLEADQRLCFRCSLSYLHTKFQASSHLQWLYSPVCVGPGQKPRRPVFSERGSNILSRFTADGVVPAPKMAPRTSSIVQIICSFLVL